MVNKMWAKCPNRKARTQPGRDGLNRRFERQVPPEVTDPKLRAKMAAKAREAFFQELTIKSIEARKANKARREGAA